MEKQWETGSWRTHQNVLDHESASDLSSRMPTDPGHWLAGTDLRPMGLEQDAIEMVLAREASVAAAQTCSRELMTKEVLLTLGPEASVHGSNH